MLIGMSKHLVYAFPGFYNKETISSNNFFLFPCLVLLILFSLVCLATVCLNFFLFIFCDNHLKCTNLKVICKTTFFLSFSFFFLKRK